MLLTNVRPMAFTLCKTALGDTWRQRQIAECGGVLRVGGVMKAVDDFKPQRDGQGGEQKDQGPKCNFHAISPMNRQFS